MAINLITWAGQTVTPKDDAIIQDACAGRSGILYGCGVTASGNTLTVASGYGVIKGRLFEVTNDSLNISLPSSGTLKGVLYIRLDLANSSEPIEIAAQTGSTAYQVQQDANANFNSGVYEMELAKFDVSRSGISNLTVSESKVPYNRTPVYQSMADLGVPASTVTYPLRIFERYMADNSIAILSSDSIGVDLPYENASGICIIIRKDASCGKALFLSDGGKPNYQYSMSEADGVWIYEWVPFATEDDVYYTYGHNPGGAQNTYRLYFGLGGFITNGGQDILAYIPLNRRVPDGYKLVFSPNTGGVTVRQNGKYLLGSGSSSNDFETDVSTTCTTYENIAVFTIRRNGGYEGGVNNAPVAVQGWAEVWIDVR